MTNNSPTSPSQPQLVEVAYSEQPGFTPTKYILAVRDMEHARCRYFDVIAQVIDDEKTWDSARAALSEYNALRMKVDRIEKAWEDSKGPCTCDPSPFWWGVACSACLARSYLAVDEDGFAYDPPYIKVQIAPPGPPVVTQI